MRTIGPRDAFFSSFARPSSLLGAPSVSASAVSSEERRVAERLEHAHRARAETAPAPLLRASPWLVAAPLRGVRGGLLGLEVALHLLGREAERLAAELEALDERRARRARAGASRSPCACRVIAALAHVERAVATAHDDREGRRRPHHHALEDGLPADVGPCRLALGGGERASGTARGAVGRPRQTCSSTLRTSSTRASEPDSRRRTQLRPRQLRRPRRLAAAARPWPWPRRRALRRVALAEAIDAAGRVHELLRARVERVAVRAHVDLEVAARRPGHEGVAAGAAHRRGRVIGMNAFFHGILCSPLRK